MEKIIALLFVILLLVPSHSSSQTSERRKYWIYFRDKGPLHLLKSSDLYQQAKAFVTPRALARRAKMQSSESPITENDFPLSQEYLNQIRDLGGTIVHEVRWMNAASVYLTSEEVVKAQALPFVKEITPVAVLHGRELPKPIKFLDQDRSSLLQQEQNDPFNYGASRTQIEIINVPQLHQWGITGKNVLAGMLDTGFRWRTHQALSTRRVIGEHDFIFNDDITANESGDAGTQDQHGTATFSTMGGFYPGKLIGPAFDAEYFLAKTEDIRSETRIEEDNWVHAMEWMENQGVEVVSISLGYNDFDPPGPTPEDYTWEGGSFDGRTTITAQAAIRAARLGVLICTAMGNEGQGNGTVGTMLTPADADSTISVGAISATSRQLAGFSSTGPTNDGRIKPDVVAPGIGVYAATASTIDSSYQYQNGTSLATPLVGGVAALLLSVRPELTPAQARDIIRNTADTVAVSSFPIRPNNFTGWGLVNALKAVLAVGPFFSNEPTITVTSAESSIVSTVAVSQSGLRSDRVLLSYAVGDTGGSFTSIAMVLDSATIFPTSGRYLVTLPQQPLGTIVRFYIDVEDSMGNSYRSPSPYYGSSWRLRYGEGSVDRLREPVRGIPERYVLKQNYPNPFPTPSNPQTIISYSLPEQTHVRLRVFNALGQLVAVLIDGMENAGSDKQVVFDAGNLPSGVYFYQLETSTVTLVRKLLIIR